MVIIYFVLSSVLLLFVSGAAGMYRDTQSGAVHVVLTVLTVAVILLRIGNFLSKVLYRAWSETHKKVTISDLMLFDGAVFLLYGILAGLGDNIRDVRGWVYFCVIWIPAFGIAAYVIVRRFRTAYILYQKKHDRNYEKTFINY